ncbi:MAG: BTAD domain-containing putative transcriptional regulator [Chloroflexota bacterium]
MPVQIRILGEPAVLDGRGRSRVRGRGQLALLTLLVLHRDQVLSADRIRELLFPDEGAVSSKALPMAISRLRTSLGEEADRLATLPGGYRFDASGADLDADRFTAGLRAGRAAWASGDAAATVERLRDALQAWTGAALGSLASEAWAVADAQRLEDERLQAIELGLEAELGLGPPETLMTEITRLADEHPAREALTRLKMLALYRSGRQVDALAAYRSTRAYLGESLGLDPSPSLQALELAILRQDPSLAPVTPTRSNLPVDLDLLVGRRDEIAEVTELIARHRLVTLHGPGGTGKTRLALEIGRADPFGRGGILVELAAITDPARVLPEIASALGLPSIDPEAIPALVANRLGSAPSLVLLDNFEQILDAGEAVASLLRSTPQLHLLITSRAPLRVRGEHIYEVDPLQVPSEGATADEVKETDASRLFLDRASAEDRRWQPDLIELEAVGRLCRLLDGLPLAIELAAGLVRTGALPVLASGMTALLPFLNDGPRDLPPRQRSLRATIAWSRDLLSPGARHLFDRLGCFLGGWSLEAASHVAQISPADAAEAMDELVSRSLVRRAAGPDGRFDMLETIREYAAELLDGLPDGEAARRRHARYVASWMIDGGMRDGDANRRRQLLLEQPNLRRALEWALDHDPGMALELASVATDFWDDAGLWPDGIGFLVAALERNPEPTTGRAHALVEAGVMSAGLGDYDTALDFMEQSRALYAELGDPLRAAKGFIPISGVLTLRSDFERAGATGRQALAALTDPEHLDAATLARLHLADLSWLGGNPEAGLTMARTALDDANQIGQRMYQLMARYVISAALLFSGDLAGARKESLAVLDTTDRPGYAKYRGVQAAIHARIELLYGDLAAADRWSRESVRASGAINDRWSGAIALEVLAEVAASIGDVHRSALALGAAQTVRERLGASTPPAFQASVLATTASLELALSSEDLAQRLAEGRGMSLIVAARGLAAAN